MRVMILAIVFVWFWLVARLGSSPPDSQTVLWLAAGALFAAAVWVGPLVTKLWKFLIADEVWLRDGKVVVRRGLIVRRYFPDATMQLKRVARVAGWSKDPFQEEQFGRYLRALAIIGNLFPRRRRDFYELWIGERHRDRPIARFYHPSQRMERSIPPQIGMQLLEQEILELRAQQGESPDRS